jgi:TM2 domain-containing membrane protein YozV
MPNAFQLMPSLEPDEMAFVQMLIKDMNDNQSQQFAMSYMSRRKDPSNMLLFTLIGFLGIAGVQRFVLGQVGLGILYLFTGGLCVIGTIVDLVNYKKLAYEFNTKQAQQVATMMRAYSA